MEPEAYGGLTVLLIPVSPRAHRTGVLSECACCAAHYPVKRTAMRLSAGGSDLGSICPECILLGPKGTADRLRSRKVEGPDAARPDIAAGRSRASIDSLNDLFEIKAAALETLDAFPLAARQAAVRETRERR